MAYSLVSLILDLTDGTGTPVNRGAATLAPSAQLVDATDNLLVVQAPVWAQFTGSTTYPQVSLLPTDSLNLAPSGWGWTISFITVPGRPASYSFFLPAGPAAFTAGDGSPCTFTFTPTADLTQLPDSAGVQLSGGSLPGGFAAGVTYYVLNASGYSFQLAATVNGPPLASTSAGGGSVAVVSCYLSSLSPVASVVTMQAYMPLPSGVPVAGNVPVASGAGDASAWGTLSSLVLDDSTGAAWDVAVADNGALFTCGIVQDQAGGWILDQDSSPLEMPDDATTGVTSVTAGDASVVIGGTDGSPTVETGTLDEIANLHPPAANWSNNSKKITSLANGSAAQDAAAFGQIPSPSSPLATTAGGTGVSESSDAALLAALGAAPLASPALTGVPTAPTAAALTDSTTIATTGYADSAVAAEKTRALAAEALLAPLASPALTGAPTAPTAAAGDASAQVATDAFVAGANAYFLRVFAV